MYCDECDKALSGERPTKLTRQLLSIIAASFKFDVRSADSDFFSHKFHVGHIDLVDNLDDH